jgi:hypothetical protein
VDPRLTLELAAVAKLNQREPTVRKWDEHANYLGYLNGVPWRRVYISIELEQTRKGLAIAGGRQSRPSCSTSTASGSPQVLTPASGGRVRPAPVGVRPEIHEADGERLSLVANGLVSIGAEYQLAPADGGSDVRGSASVSRRGLLGGILTRAFETVLAAGAPRPSVARIGRELEPTPA